MGLCLRRLRLQYPLQGWQGSTGISGSFQSESVAIFAWNRWQVSTGISGNLRAEYAYQWSSMSAPVFAHDGRDHRHDLQFVLGHNRLIARVGRRQVQRRAALAQIFHGPLAIAFRNDDLADARRIGALDEHPIARKDTRLQH